MKFKYKSILTAVFAASFLSTVTTGCLDEFAEINTDPSSVNEPNATYLFTQSLKDFEPSDYLYWFYSGKYMAQWGQAFVPSGGYAERFNEMTANGGLGAQFVKVLNIKRELDHYASVLESKGETFKASQMNEIRAILKSLTVYLGLFDTDMYGSVPYSEACLGRHGGTQTPKYDTMSELYAQWAKELDEAIATLSDPKLKDQLPLGHQDIVYGGKRDKWLKFANGVKLKIAVRLLHQDRAKALKMAEQVGANAAFVMNATADDFVYNKGDQDYHFGNGASLGLASKNVLDFMLKNRDPRLRFMFTKNQFNSEIVQSFFDLEAKAVAEGKPVTFAIPKYILDNVDYTTDANGKKTFKAWKGLGEPWVRFYGIPVEMEAGNNPIYKADNNYFDPSKWELTDTRKNSEGEDESTSKTYTPYSAFNQEMVRGQIDFTFPTKPFGAVKEDTENVSWYGMYLSTAEVNLYLAEFKLLGANLPLTAEQYYNKAIEASVTAYDRLAGLNKIPYYDESRCYDPNEKPLKLVAGEIATLMGSADYQLTGTPAEQLEKIYIQQFLHFMYQPADQFAAVRRSGVPKVNSTLIPWVNLVSKTLIPRRFGVIEPSNTDVMYDIVKKAYADQGFTTGVDNSALLNSERVWSDKGAPNFGEGPNFSAQ